MEELYKNISKAAGKDQADWLVKKLNEVAIKNPDKIKSLINMARFTL